MTGTARAAAGIALVVSMTLAAPARADDQDALAYRQKIMSAMNEQSAILGQIASGLAPKDNVTAHLDTMALLASTALKSFEPKVPGGEAKPQVWTDWADFSARMSEFARQTDEAAKLARTMGPDAALTNMLDALSCRSCHRAYRTEKKKK